MDRFWKDRHATGNENHLPSFPACLPALRCGVHAYAGCVQSSPVQSSSVQSSPVPVRIYPSIHPFTIRDRIGSDQNSPRPIAKSKDPAAG
eukprot:jgi/Psemu1/303698/fgenesh1_kg.119_\